MPVAQIVAGFGKVFVGEIVEKGVCPLSFLLVAYSSIFQRVSFRSDAAKPAHSLPTICARRTACTRRRRVVSAPHVRCALSGSSLANLRPVHEWLRIRISPRSVTYVSTHSVFRAVVSTHF